VKKIFLIIPIVFILYFGGASIVLKYYLSDVIFKKLPNVETSEIIRYKVNINKDELVIRQYGVSSNTKCVIFFPGQHGGIKRYEKEIFKDIVDKEMTLFAFSYPGFEGASGKSNFTSILDTSILALSRIENKTSCEIRSSVYLGRSLGASVALEVAKLSHPKAIVLDSLALSLSSSIRGKFKNSYLTKPLNILPIENLVDFNVSTKTSLNKLKKIPIIVFQGELDKITPLKNIDSLLKKYDNVTLNVIKLATHKNTHLLAGDKYSNAILELM